MKVDLKEYLTTLYAYFNILIPVPCVIHYLVQLIVNCFTNCNLHNSVTRHGTNYELPDDDAIVSKHVAGV